MRREENREKEKGEGRGKEVGASRGRAEEALKESETRLHMAHLAANAGTWEWDLRTNQNIWSEELWEVYGLVPHSCEPSFESWLGTVHPDDRDLVSQAVQDASRAGAELAGEAAGVVTGIDQQIFFGLRIEAG